MIGAVFNIYVNLLRNKWTAHMNDENIVMHSPKNSEHDFIITIRKLGWYRYTHECGNSLVCEVESSDDKSLLGSPRFYYDGREISDKSFFDLLTFYGSK